MGPPSIPHRADPPLTGYPPPTGLIPQCDGWLGHSAFMSKRTCSVQNDHWWSGHAVSSVLNLSAVVSASNGLPESNRLPFTKCGHSANHAVCGNCLCITPLNRTMRRPPGGNFAGGGGADPRTPKETGIVDRSHPDSSGRNTAYFRNVGIFAHWQVIRAEIHCWDNTPSWLEAHSPSRVWRRIRQACW